MGDGSILGSMQGNTVDPSGGGQPADTSMLPFERNAAMLEDFSKRSALETKDKMPFEELVKSGVEVSYGQKGLSLKNLDPRLVIGMMEKSKRLDTIMGAMQQEGQRLQAQREKLDTTGGRIGNVASVLAGNLASQRDMPGWVQGAGRAALQLNPTRDQVTAQQMQLGEEEAKIGESQMRLMESRLRAEEISSYREAEHQRREEADVARKEARAREDEIKKQDEQRKKEADAEKAQHNRENERARNLKRVLDEGKAAGGRIDAAELAKLDPADRAEARATMKGIRESEQAKQEQRSALVKLRTEGKMAVANATIEARKALAQVGTMNKGAQDALRVRVAGLVSAAAGKHGAHQTAVQTMLTVDPAQVPALLANYAPEEEAFKNLLKIQGELEAKIQGQPAGPTMSSPEAAAKAKGNQNPLGLALGN